MLFNSIAFVLFFISVLSGISIYKKRIFQYSLLLFASYFFLYYSSNYLVILLIFSTVWDFYLAKKIYQSKNIKYKKFLLILSLAGNLGLLGLFKYYDFAITQFNILGNYFDLATSIPLLNLVLPIGISFYTFQTISYTIDVYRGHLTPSKSFFEFALFVAFFPQLVAGPIIRASHFLPQLREKLSEFETGTRLRQIIIQNSNLKLGITIMAIGFFKKMFFADNIAPLVDSIFLIPTALDSSSVLLGTIAFGIQIYCDFSGYSDIAIGAALILGFNIPANFNKPFFATSPSNFWQRWHISLSTWVKDYIYTPLAFKNRKSQLRLTIVLIGSMFLLGLWHGASWNFVIFGVLWGIVMAGHRIILYKFPSLKFNSFFKTKIGIIISIIITQYFVFLAFIPFRIPDFDYMLYAIQKYIFWDFSTFDAIPFMVDNKFAVLLIGLFFVLQFITYKNIFTKEKIANYKNRYWFGIITIITVLIFFLASRDPGNFIYFQF